MAVITPIAGVNPQNRRHGIAFYQYIDSPNSTGLQEPYKLVARAAPAPVQPATLRQASAQNILSTVAQCWAALTPAQQALWVGGPNGLVGYPFYTLVTQYALTWGFFPSPVPPRFVNFSGFVNATPLWDGTPGPYNVSFEVTTFTGLTVNYLAVYLQVSSLIPFYISQLANTDPAGKAKASGFVYVGLLGPLTTLVPAVVDFTDVILAMFGQYPVVGQIQDDEFRYYTGFFELSTVVNFGPGYLYIAFTTNPPAPATPVQTIPLPAGNYASYLGIPGAPGPLLRPYSGVPPRFWPARALWRSLDASRVRRGLGRQGAAAYAAGIPVVHTALGALGQLGVARGGPPKG